jgi:hypothetical protein
MGIINWKHCRRNRSGLLKELCGNLHGDNEKRTKDLLSPPNFEPVMYGIQFMAYSFTQLALLVYVEEDVYQMMHNFRSAASVIESSSRSPCLKHAFIWETWNI